MSSNIGFVDLFLILLLLTPHRPGRFYQSHFPPCLLPFFPPSFPPSFRQQRTPDRSGHCRTSTASSRLGPAVPQPRGSELSGHLGNRWSSRLRSVHTEIWRSRLGPCQRECQNRCQKEWQNECQIEWQN